MCRGFHKEVSRTDCPERTEITRAEKVEVNDAIAETAPVAATREPLVGHVLLSGAMLVLSGPLLDLSWAILGHLVPVLSLLGPFLGLS